jgi:hypothetical protein
MALTRLVPGGAWAVVFERKDVTYPTPASRRALFVFDPPASAPASVQRISKVYDPAGGSDPECTVSGTDVVCTLTPADTRLMADSPGLWSVYILVGAAAAQSPVLPNLTSQSVHASAILPVEQMSRGGL